MSGMGTIPSGRTVCCMVMVEKKSPVSKDTEDPWYDLWAEELIDAAMTEPGEWFSVEVPVSHRKGTAAAKARLQVSKRFAQIQQQNGRIYLRIIRKT